jgi:hypothetical protein
MQAYTRSGYSLLPELCTERGLRAPEGAVGALVGLRLPRVI